MLEQNNQKTCPECGEIIRGRADKVFCSDQCRNQHNNKANSDITNLMRNINNILRKNRRILDELIPEETAKATRNKLNEKGFNFNYYTHTYTNKKGTIYYFCYDMGYLPLENEYYFLVRRKEEN
jgi:precorrin-6B methylase 2